MNKKRISLMITSVLVMGAIWGFIFLEKNTTVFKGLDLVIFILIIVLSGVALYRARKRDKEEKEGFVADDEFSNMLKYKAGYYAYLGSMYLWMFIFFFKDKFPDNASMIGGGILLSGLIGFIAKIVVKRNMNE